MDRDGFGLWSEVSLHNQYLSFPDSDMSLSLEQAPSGEVVETCAHSYRNSTGSRLSDRPNLSSHPPRSVGIFSSHHSILLSNDGMAI